MKNKRINRLNIKRKYLALAVASCFVSHVNANPTGANVVRGSASLSTHGNTLTIENSPGTIINWHDFSINAGETTIFNQVNAASAVLNRVTGGNISQILGTLQSNGRVFLINPSGIVFGQNAVVNVAGLVASTLNMTDDNFVNNKMVFNATSPNVGSVINQGQISTPNGGFVYLIATNVENSGVINTPSGEAILAAGNAVELVDSTDPRQRVLVKAENNDVNLSQMMTQSNGNIFSVLNKGVVSANTVQQDASGRVFFKSAGAIETTTSSVVEVKGSVNANGGTFIGFADSLGKYAGSYDASGQNGGFIETSGKYLDITGLSNISAKALSESGKAGTWLLDPYNIEITAAAGGNISGGPNFSPTGSPSQLPKGFIEAALNSGTNVVVDTANAGGTENGNIIINASIEMTGSSNASLTFNADGLIVMGASSSITDTGTGNLSVNMLSDRDGIGAGGGISVTIIDVGGDVNLTSNTGDFSFGGATASQVVRGRSVTLDIDGNVNLSGGSLFNESALIESTNGDVSITAGGSLNLLGGSHIGSNTSVGILSSHNVFIDTGSDIDIQGGTGSNSKAYIFGDGDVNIRTGFNSGGNVILTGGTGASSNAELQSQGGDLEIEFKSAGLILDLRGGASGVTDGAASILALAGDIIIKGDIDAHNPTLTISGGNIATADAGIAGNSISNLRVSSLDMLAGPAGDAFIATTNTSGVSPININVTDGANSGSVTLTGAAGTKAEIGSQTGNINLQLTAGSVNLLGTAVSSVAGLGASGSNNAIVNINANNGVIIAGAGARVGSVSGNAQISIDASASASDAIQIVNGASVGSAVGGQSINLTGTSLGAGRGVTITNSSVSNNVGGNGSISIVGIANGTGNTDGVLINGTSEIKTGSGNISISGTGSASGSSAAGVAIADSTNISTSSGNIVINGTGQSSSGNSFGIVSFGSPSPTLTSSSGNIFLTGTSVVPTNIGLTTTSISASSGNVTIRGTNGNLALDSATISAGNNINLIATNGDINQNSSGSLTSANLNVNALGAFLNFSSANAFNTATFAVDTLSVKNNASGTVSYELTRPTSVVLMDAQNASGLRVNADQGFSMSGGGQINSGGNLSINASDVNLNNASLLAGNNLNVAANNINMVGGSVFDATADVNVLTKNLSMTNSQIQGTNININSVNLAGKLADAGTSSASVLDIFSRITQSAVISMQNSNIEASNNANVAGSSIKLTGSTIQSGNFTTVFSRGTIELEGGAASRGVGITSEIFAENEVLMIAGGQIILNDGASGAGAVVSTNSPNTIYLGFPLLTNNGFLVNGVLDAITNGNSGFFAGGAPAVLDTNLFVTYGGVNGLLRAFFNQNITLQSTSSEISISPDSKSVNKKDDDQKECS